MYILWNDAMIVCWGILLNKIINIYVYVKNVYKYYNKVQIAVLIVK